MKTRLLAAILSVGGLLLSGCSSTDRAVAVVAPTTATPIRSQSDLQRYSSSTPLSVSPLGALSAGARDRFLSSITFNAKGITGFHYTDLQSELTASQIYDVLKLFGAEKDVAIIPNVRIETSADKRVMGGIPIAPGDGGGSFDSPDYPGYECVSRATCAPKTGDICMGSC